MSKILIIKKGITRFDTECIVNAANSDLMYGGGVCGAIFEAAGISQLTRACNSIGHCNTGDAVITPSFNIKNAKYIIHAVGPIYSLSRKQECRDELYSSYKRSLEVMLENGCSSIAFPLISSGIYGYPNEEAWRIAIKACNTFIKQHEDKNISIYFAVISDQAHEMGNLILKEVLTKDHDDSVLRLYEAIGVLHEKGYQNIRVMSYFSPSGMYFRSVLSLKKYFDKTGFVCDETSSNNQIYHYTSGQEFNYFDDNTSYENSTIEELAEALLEKYPFLKIEGKGSDKEYADWFKMVLKYARNGIFPFAFDDYGYDIYQAQHIEMTNGDTIEYAPPGGKQRIVG